MPLDLIFKDFVPFLKKIKPFLDKVSNGSSQKCSKELKNHSFPSVETIVVKLQWTKCAKINIFHVLSHKSIITYWVREIPEQWLEPGKSYKNSFSTYLTHIHTCILLTLLTFLPYRFWKKKYEFNLSGMVSLWYDSWWVWTSIDGVYRRNDSFWNNTIRRNYPSK